MRSSMWLVAAASLLLAGCGDENATLRGEFLSGCVRGGSPKSACECLFGKLEEHYSPKELRALNQTATPPPEFKRVIGQGILACRNQ